MGGAANFESPWSCRCNDPLAGEATRRRQKAALGDQKATGCSGEVDMMVKATPVPVLVRAGAVNSLCGPALLEVLLGFLAAPDFREVVSPPAAHKISFSFARYRQLRQLIAAFE